jgi:septal ring factor EnvC (AmiA/AmiB activator)
MPDTEKKVGIFIPEWLMKVVQGLLVTAMLAVWGMIWNQHNTLAAQTKDIEALQEKVAKFEGRMQDHENAEDEIKTSLTRIETELPFIRGGITELKGLLMDGR